MVIANSGGALVLASLCNDMKISEVISVLKDETRRKKVFSALSFWEKMTPNNIASLFTKVLGPRYKAERKLNGLTDVLKEKDHLFNDRIIDKPIVETYLNELPRIIKKDSLQILIVGFDYFRERVSFFRSNTNSVTDMFNENYFRVTLGHAIHSSSNAPVNYFDSPAEITINRLKRKESDKEDNRKIWYWDGAVSGFNNPVLAGLIEAMTNNHGNPQQYSILSIGTGVRSKPVLTDMGTSNNPDIKKISDRNKGNPLTISDPSVGFLKDVRKMSTSVLGDPPDSATFIAYSILDPSLSNKASLVRINPCISPEKDDSGYYDTPLVYKNIDNGDEKFRTLIELDMDATEDEAVNLIDEMCNKFIVTDGSPCIYNQLIRGNPGQYPFLGHATYKEAKDHWIVQGI
jgi:hypothetical protein